MSNPLTSRSSGRSTIRLSPDSETVRHCSKVGHESRKAVAIRITSSNAPRQHTSFAPECAECASIPPKKAKGILQQVTRFA